MSAASPSAFRSLVVPVELSPGFERVVGRALRLPLARDARVTLLHVVPRGLPARLAAAAEREARAALQAMAASVSAAGSVRVRALVARGSVPDEIAGRADADEAELIVLGRGGGRGFREVFLGSTAERVLRGARRPVLATRLPARGPYARPVVALELDQAAPRVLALALRVLAPPRPALTLVHACGAPFHGLSYSSLTPEAAQDYRDALRHTVNERLARLAVGALAEASRDEHRAWRTWIREGPPRTVIPAAVRRARADLLVLGTHGVSGARYAFLGSVAGDVLREVACDVLVVPPGGGAR